MNQQQMILVIDGQGGGIGKSIVEQLKKQLPHIFIRALGTNSLATSRMIKAGADDGATGENAIVINAKRADVIIGAMGIVMPNAILGELTPKMAQAIVSSEAIKILLPIDRCQTRIVTLQEGTMAQYIQRAVEMVEEILSV